MLVRFEVNTANTATMALARYDDNGDGKLDAQDAIWNELKVWQDLNQDGKTEGDGTELKTLAAWEDTKKTFRLGAKRDCLIQGFQHYFKSIVAGIYMCFGDLPVACKKNSHNSKNGKFIVLTKILFHKC